MGPSWLPQLQIFSRGGGPPGTWELFEIAIPAFWEKCPVKTPSSPTPNWGSTKGCPTPLRRFKTCWYTPLFLHRTPNTFLQVPKDPTGQKTLKFQHKSDNTPTAHCLLSYIHTLFKNQSPPPPPKHPPLKWPEWTLNRRLVSLNEERKACPLTTDSSVGHHQFKMIVPGKLTLKISCKIFLNLSLYILNVWLNFSSPT